MKKQKIAVLGGGLGALTTAFELTNDPNWKDRYESITVYQMGWRLGGKGASGRNPDLSNRIEEHGLHVFMGFYDNAFHMMKALYKECLDKNLTPNSPFATARDAFSKLNLVVLTDRVGNRWELWPHSWTESEEFPGSEQPLAGGVKPFILELALLAADRVIEALPVPGDLRTALLNTARMLAEGGVTKLLANLVVRASTALSNFLHKTLGMPHLAGLVHPAAHTTLRAAGAGRREPLRIMKPN